MTSPLYAGSTLTVVLFKCGTAEFVQSKECHWNLKTVHGFLVAAAERGRRVLVSRDTTFEVGDHDFMSIVPSVCFVTDIPESVESSWYTGKALVGLKEAIFEPSSPSRHNSAEFYDVLTTQDLQMKPVMFMYTDSGPDHRLTYLSVQMSLTSLFLELDLDLLCASCTAPFHSWRNPVERIMSILNLGLQSIGLMRKQVEGRLESTISKCNNMKQLRAAAQKNQSLSMKSWIACLLWKLSLRMSFAV